MSKQNDLSVFIGSSSEGKEVAEYLQVALDNYCEPVTWDQGIFQPSSNTLESLVTASQKFDFAILVLTPDDLVLKRGNVKNASRDNVIFELGLFMGSLGQSRTFIVHRRDDIIDIPSDLAGITRLTFNHRTDNNTQAAINPVAIKIREILKTKGKRTESVVKTKVDTTFVNEGLVSSGFTRYIYDLIEALPRERMGITASITNEKAFYIWTKNLLGMLRDLYSSRQKDVYTSWLRPTTDNPQLLEIFQSQNMPAEYEPYKFHLGEGLAGKVWETGHPAATSTLRQHTWWVYREGCLSESYICVPIGEPKKRGGVLAVGSFQGFETTDTDIEVVKVFAGLLALVELPASK